jgi:AcrR family transcriptional regulator
MKDTRERLLAAAIRVFGQNGVSGATTREIARVAKVNEVTLFRYFKSKDELLRHVVVQASKRFEDIFAEAPFETPHDLRRTVRTFALTYVRILRDNEDFARTFFGELNRHLKLCRNLFVESSKAKRQKFIDYLKAAQKRGLVRRNIDISTAADALTGMLFAGVMRRPLTRSLYSNERYVKTCLDVFLKGIEP